MAQGQGYTVKAIEPVAIGSDVQARVFTLAPGEVIPWHFHSAVTDWYFVLEGTLSIETRAPADRRELAVGGTYHIAPKTAHLISNRSEADTRFLLVQGVGPYDFLKVGGQSFHAPPGERSRWPSLLRLDQPLDEPPLHREHDGDRRQQCQECGRHDEMPCGLRVAVADHLADADDDRRHRRVLVTSNGQRYWFQP